MKLDPGSGSRQCHSRISRSGRRRPLELERAERGEHEREERVRVERGGARTLRQPKVRGTGGRACTRGIWAASGGPARRASSRWPSSSWTHRERDHRLRARVERRRCAAASRSLHQHVRVEDAEDEGDAAALLERRRRSCSAAGAPRGRGARARRRLSTSRRAAGARAVGRAGRGRAPAAEPRAQWSARPPDGRQQRERVLT